METPSEQCIWHAKWAAENPLTDTTRKIVKIRVATKMILLEPLWRLQVNSLST